MKTFLIALTGLFALSLGATPLEAKDKDKDRKHDSKHDSKYRGRDHHSRTTYRNYPHTSYYRSYSAPRYYSYPRTYSDYPVYRERSYGYRSYQYREPVITFSFGR